MPDKQPVIREGIGADAVVDLIAALSGRDGARIEKKVYYPYFQFAGKCTVPTLFGRRDTEITCLVDAANGLGATADSYCVDRCRLADSELIDIGITTEAALRAARRTVTHRLSRRLRVIAPFDLALEAKGIVYKGFWIVRSEGVRVMVDSVNGSMHPLRVCAA